MHLGLTIGKIAGVIRCRRLLPCAALSGEHSCGSSFVGLKRVIATLLTLTFSAIAGVGQAPPSIVRDKSSIHIVAGSLKRDILLARDVLLTSRLSVEGEQVLVADSPEFSFTLYAASPDRKPQGLATGEGGAIDATPISGKTDTLTVQGQTSGPVNATQWIDASVIDGKQWGHFFPRQKSSITHKSGTETLKITGIGNGLTVSLCYETYDGFPAIRKWIKITNTGSHWTKVDNLRIEDWEFGPGFSFSTSLTPSERGAVSSLVAMGRQDASSGVILGSEIPSALRNIENTGAMGYADRYFEWILGPGESFVSEPVFEFAYSGENFKTISGVSTPLDRTVEGAFQDFLRKRIGLLANAANLPAPSYNTWSNFGPKVDSAEVEEMAPLAARAGFKILTLDEGWQRNRFDTDPDPDKFPDLQAAANAVHAAGLRFGLWVSTFRSANSRDLRALPDAASRPALRRDGGGLGMSFAGPWRQYYVNDLVSLARQYGVTYFKQDLSSIRFGDFAEGHESRSLKESLLRGLRGMLQAQDLIRRSVPGVTLEITHEIYWGTPGVPCDLAALEHANLYHIPPNDYSGDGNNKLRYQDQKTAYTVETHQRDLIAGSLHARQRLYAHRGLPLDALEYYGATTMSFNGTLTPAIQDRQVASWLMGAPMVFAGDLASLTEANLAHYKARFDLLQRLQENYGIYDHFEFSGVPSAPTDDGWQWWGKLNADGYGVVVVLRGVGGEDSRSINIPWVQSGRSYRVKALFQDRDLGEFSGVQLQKGKLEIALSEYGQELLEISPASAH